MVMRGSTSHCIISVTLVIIKTATMKRFLIDRFHHTYMARNYVNNMTFTQNLMCLDISTGSAIDGTKIKRGYI